MEDSGIIELYWLRSEDAIAETANKYGKYCYTIAYNILSNIQDANESVNDTYLGAWNAIPPQRPTALSAFLGKITRRISIDKWRRRSAEKRGGGEIPLALCELSLCVPSSSNPQQELEAKELTEEINAFLSTLAEADRNIFVCRYWLLAPISEISAKTGFTEGKIKMSLYRTREKLRNYLKRRGY